MFYYAYHDNCTAEELNNTIEDHDLFVGIEKFNVLIIFPIAIIALIANSCSLHIFRRQNFDNKAVRFSLLSISTIEILLQISLIIETVIVRTDFEHFHTVFTYTFTSITHTNINAFVSIRNWCVLLISSARCEVIARPLASRRFLLFTRARLIIMLAVVIIIAFALALLSNLHYQGIICTNLYDGNNRAILQYPLLMTTSSNYIIPEMIFIYQSLIPVLLIPVPTLVMWFKLRKSIPAEEVKSPIHGNHRRRALSSYRASQMVFGLGLLFCVMEVPTFVTTIILKKFPGLPNKLPIHPDTVTNVLSVTDSFLNFFVYAASSARFRREFVLLLHRCCFNMFIRKEDRDHRISNCSVQMMPLVNGKQKTSVASSNAYETALETVGSV